MSDPNQNKNQQVQNEKPRTVRIRMKPGCGRMMIGRKYKIIDGTVADKRPRSMDELSDTEEIWLEQGQIVEVPVSFIAPFLDKEGKLSRVVEGYPMVKVPGQEARTDEETGLAVRATQDTWRAGTVRYAGDELIASHQDCTFEIVQDSRAA
jgi:hypothetical protein